MLSINVEPAKKMRRHYLIATVLLAAAGLCLFLFSGDETTYENDRYPPSGVIDAADKRQAPIELAWPAPHTPLAAEPENAPAPPLAEVSDDASEDDRSEADPSEETTDAWKSLRTLGSPERLEVRIVKFLEFNPVDQLRPEQIIGLAKSISFCGELPGRPEDIERWYSELYFSGTLESEIHALDEMCEGVTPDHVSDASRWLFSAAESGEMQAINALIDSTPPELAEFYFQGGALDSPEIEAINARYYPQALALLEKSIAQGNIRGAVKMAYHMLTGVIVEKDDIKAVGYYMAVAAVTGEYKWQHVAELFSKELFFYEIEQAQLFSKQVLKDWASLKAVYF